MFRASIRPVAFAAILLALTGFALGLAHRPAAAQSAADSAAIQGTIRSQMEAIQADDWNRAFGYASPMIQGIFGDPDNFSRMVVNGYPMVWRPKTYRPGALTAEPDGYNQVMIIEDQQGRLFIADYRMVLVDGEWRINGVTIRPAPGESA